MFQVKVDTTQVEKRLKKYATRDARNAVKIGLTKTAFDVRDRERRQMKNYLDRPRPFTINGIVSKGATLSRLTSYVFMRPIQRRYLYWQIMGGSTRLPNLVPARGFPLDGYGNIPRHTTKGGNVLETTLKGGQRAYFRRTGGRGDYRAEMIGFIPFSRTYRKRFPFYLIAEVEAKRRLKQQINRQLDKVQ